MQVEVWSDLVCPWCYLGKRRLERALERLPEGTAVEVVGRAHDHADPLADGQLRDARVLASDAHADAVRADARAAQELGCRGGPSFALPG